MNWNKVVYLGSRLYSRFCARCSLIHFLGCWNDGAKRIGELPSILVIWQGLISRTTCQSLSSDLQLAARVRSEGSSAITHTLIVANIKCNVYHDQTSFGNRNRIGENNLEARIQMVKGHAGFGGRALTPCRMTEGGTEYTL